MPVSDFNVTQFIFNVAGKEFRVRDFTAKEHISLPYSVELTLASEKEVNFDDVVGNQGLLTIYHEDMDRDRYFHGIVNKFIQTGKTNRFYMYRVNLVPKLKLLSLEQDCRIFQNKSTKDIVTQILTESGILSNSFAFRLLREPEPKEYCVQYRETDLNFISRLLEEDGILYFFEHFKDKHLLIFTDIQGKGHTIKGDPEVLFNYSGGVVPMEKNFMHTFTLSKEICSGKATISDFNFEKPALNLKVEWEAPENQNLEIYDYPGPHSLQAQGNPLVKTRLEESVSFKERANGTSNCSQFTPGVTFNLSDHDNDNFNQEYMIVSVSHSGDQPQVLEEEERGKGFSYGNRFWGVPASVNIKPKRITPKPMVRGVQTAIVTGPGAEEIYTDKHGRVKVQFHWDREGKKNDKSSCWIRVSQLWAGTNWGAMYIPRVGQEVIVDFLEGNPDRPIITGRVYHATNIPPYQLPANKTKSTIKSRSTPNGKGSNEIRFEDQKGSEELYIHGQKDWTIAIENDKNQTIGHDETMDVGNDRTKNVQKNQSETIGENKTISVGKDHTESITENKSMDIGKNHTESIGENADITVGKNETVSIGENLTETIGKDHKAQVDGNCGIVVAKQMTTQVTDEILIKSDKQIKLETGSASILMKSNGDIIIEGGKIILKSSGELVLKGSKISEN